MSGDVIQFDEWVRRRAEGWTACTCRADHRGCCSSPTNVQPVRDWKQLDMFNQPNGEH